MKIVNRSFIYCAMLCMAITASMGHAAITKLTVYQKEVRNPDGTRRYYHRYFFGDRHKDRADAIIKRKQQHALRKFFESIRHEKSVTAIEEMHNYTGNNKKLLTTVKQINAQELFLENVGQGMAFVKKYGTAYYTKKDPVGGPYKFEKLEIPISKHLISTMDGLCDIARTAGVSAFNAEFRHASCLKGPSHNPIHACNEIITDTEAAFTKIKTAHTRKPILPDWLYTDIIDHNKRMHRDYDHRKDHLTKTEIEEDICAIQWRLMDAEVFRLIHEHEEQDFDNACYFFGHAHFYDTHSLPETMHKLGYTKIKEVNGELHTPVWARTFDELGPKILFQEALDLEKELMPFIIPAHLRPNSSPPVPRSSALLHSNSNASVAGSSSSSSSSPKSTATPLRSKL